MFLEFKDRYEEYFDYLQRVGRTPKTIIEHKRMLQTWFPPSFKSKRVSKIRKADTSILEEIGRRHGDHGATRAIVAFRRYADFLQSELGIKLPFDWRDVKVPVSREKEQPVFEDHEIVTLFNVMETMEIGSVHGKRMAWTMQAFFETLFGTGLRIHEALKLRRIDFIKLKSEAKLTIVGKGNKEREVVFSERAIEKIERYLDRRNDLSEAMFVNSCGEKLIMATARSYFERLKKKMRVIGFDEIASKLKSHTFRRTLGTHLFENGANIKHVQYLLGHESERTTLRHYIRVDKRRAQLVHKNIMARFPFKEFESRYREVNGKVQVRLTDNLSRWMTIPGKGEIEEIPNSDLKLA